MYLAYYHTNSANNHWRIFSKFYICNIISQYLHIGATIAEFQYYNFTTDRCIQSKNYVIIKCLCYNSKIILFKIRNHCILCMHLLNRYVLLIFMITYITEISTYLQNSNFVLVIKSNFTAQYACE